MKKFFSIETITTFQMWLFGFIRIPLIFFCRPRVVSMSEDHFEVKIKLNRITRNHLNSMYFGVLSVGADITGGFFAMKFIQDKNLKISLIFKDFHVDFLKRAEGDVHFICNEGKIIKELVNKTERTGNRENLPIHIMASVPSISLDPVAKFVLTISLKKK